MPFNYHKWILQTRLRLLNFGKGTLEVSVTISPDNHTTGKIVTLPPQSDQHVPLAELLPPGTYIADLNDNNVHFSIKNIGTEKSAFQVEEYGPFKNTEVLPSSASTSPQALIDYMQLVLAGSDYYTMDKMLAEETSAHYKTVPNLFGSVSLLKGKMATFKLSLDEADRYFETAWTDINNETKLWCCFDWSSALIWKIMMSHISLPEKGKAIQKAVDVLNRIPSVSEDNAFSEYDQLAANCRIAFCLCYLGEEEEAFRILNEVSPPPIAAEDYNHPLLTNIFGSIQYGFSVALELKSGLLLKHLSSIISAHHPAAEDASPVRSMRVAMSVAANKGRMQPLEGFQNFLKNGHHFAPEFENLRQFIKMQYSSDEAAIDSFIPA